MNSETIIGQAPKDIETVPTGSSPVLITGGAGFIGTNLANRLLSRGEHVIIYDNLSRPGTEQNLNWIIEQHAQGQRLEIEIADIRDLYLLRRAASRARLIYHLAAQVAVTTSVTDPVRDFEANLHGTLNLLEILRHMDRPAPLIFTSTNKVYGGLEDLLLRRNGTRYEPLDEKVLTRDPGGQADAVPEPIRLFKGAADQYVMEYARIYGLKTVVFRMSCIYGPHQFGTEDQGWIAHFLFRAIRSEPLVMYGDGMQVRDILFIEDLLDAFQLAAERTSSEHVGTQPESPGRPLISEGGHSTVSVSLS